MKKNHPEFRENLIKKITHYIQTTEDAGNPEKIAEFVVREFSKPEKPFNREKLAENIRSVMKKVESGEIDWRKYKEDFGHHVAAYMG